MIAHYMQQSTPEWFEIRNGKVTGTSLSALVNRGYEKTIEKITLDALGLTIEEDRYMSEEMADGNAKEDSARVLYGLQNMESVKEYGFLQSEKYKFAGYSPDGFVGKGFKKGLEIKCPLVTTHLKYIKENKVPSGYLWQITMAFVVVDEMEEMDFVSYCPEHAEENLYIKTVKREDMSKRIEKAKKKLIELEADMEEILNKINA